MEGPKGRSSPVPAPGSLVLETNQQDVILGRGKNASNRPGNNKLRQMTMLVVEAYRDSETTEEKNSIANDIIAEIQSSGGRFLRSVTASNAKGQLVAAWEVVMYDTALSKVKQAIRDREAAGRHKAADSAIAAAATLERRQQLSAAVRGKTERPDMPVIPPRLSEQQLQFQQSGLPSVVEQPDTVITDRHRLWALQQQQQSHMRTSTRQEYPQQRPDATTMQHQHRLLLDSYPATGYPASSLAHATPQELALQQEIELLLRLQQQQQCNLSLEGGGFPLVQQPSHQQQVERRLLHPPQLGLSPQLLLMEQQLLRLQQQSRQQQSSYAAVYPSASTHQQYAGLPQQQQLDLLWPPRGQQPFASSGQNPSSRPPSSFMPLRPGDDGGISTANDGAAGGNLPLEEAVAAVILASPGASGAVEILPRKRARSRTSSSVSSSHDDKQPESKRPSSLLSQLSDPLAQQQQPFAPAGASSSQLHPLASALSQGPEQQQQSLLLQQLTSDRRLATTTAMTARQPVAAAKESSSSDGDEESQHARRSPL